MSDMPRWSHANDSVAALLEDELRLKKAMGVLMRTDKERADSAEEGLFRVVQALGFDLDGAKNARELFGPMTYCTEEARLTEAPDIAVAYAADHRKEMEAEADKYEREIERLKMRVDEAWAVIDSDYWRNRYDEDMSRGNAYVSMLRDRLRLTLTALKQRTLRGDG